MLSRLANNRWDIFCCVKQTRDLVKTRLILVSKGLLKLNVQNHFVCEW